MLQRLKNLFFLALLTVFWISPSLRPIFKYVADFHAIVAILYVFAVGFALFFLGQRSIGHANLNWIGSYQHLVLVSLFVALVVWVVYPLADELKLQMRGSDQDDCVILGVNQLLQLSNPYVLKTYLGNPCSTGPGLLFLYAPFVAAGAYPLGAVFAMTLALGTMRFAGMESYSVGVFLTLMVASIFTQEMLVVGSDLFALGCGFLVLCFCLTRFIKDRNLPGLFAMAVLAGLLASSRINFLFLGPLVAGFVILHWRSGGIVFLLVTACVALGPGFYLYISDPEVFAPLHLLGKSEILLPGVFLVCGLIASIALMALSVILVRRSIANVPLAFFLSLLPSLAALSLGDLARRGWQLAQWEGANYLMPIIPLACALIASAICLPKKATS